MVLTNVFPFTLLLVAATFLGVESQELEAVQCGATFPIGMRSMSGIYAGDGKIYLFGGYGSNAYRDTIYLYDIWADSLEKVGDIPTPSVWSALVEDSLGNLIRFGGQDAEGNELDTILRFNTSSGETEVVGILPHKKSTIGAVTYKANTALVFGTRDFYEVDLVTFQARHVGLMPRVSSGLAWDGGDRVLLFSGASEHMLYSISNNNLTDFSSPEPHSFRLMHSVVSTPKSAWIVGNRGDVVGRGNGIYEVDFETLEFRFWEVRNYPAGEDETFYWAATTYVPELNRLYNFGGVMDVTRDGVWYIDLQGGEEVRTSELPSSSNMPTTTTPTTSTTTTSTTEATPINCGFEGYSDGATIVIEDPLSPHLPGGVKIWQGATWNVSRSEAFPHPHNPYTNAYRSTGLYWVETTEEYQNFHLLGTSVLQRSIRLICNNGQMAHYNFAFDVTIDEVNA